MGHRMVGAVNYGPPHGVDGWSVSDGKAVCVCVRPGSFKHSVDCVVAVSRMVGARSIVSSKSTFLLGR